MTGFFISFGLLACGLFFLAAVLVGAAMRFGRRLNFSQRRQAGEIEVLSRSLQALERRHQLDGQRGAVLLLSLQKMQLELVALQKRLPAENQAGLGIPPSQRILH